MKYSSGLAFLLLPAVALLYFAFKGADDTLLMNWYYLPRFEETTCTVTGTGTGRTCVVQGGPCAGTHVPAVAAERAATVRGASCAVRVNASGIPPSDGCGGDAVEVLSGNVSLGRFCGNATLPDVAAGGDSFTVAARWDGSVAKYEFHVHFACDGTALPALPPRADRCATYTAGNDTYRWCWEEDIGTCPALDVVVLLDGSVSMGTFGVVIDELKAWVRRLPLSGAGAGGTAAGTRVAFVQYGPDEAVLAPRGAGRAGGRLSGSAAELEADLEWHRANLHRANFRRWASYVAPGLRQAAAMFSEEDGRQRAVYVVGDGSPDDAKHDQLAVDALRDQGAEVFGIVVDADMDEREALTEMSPLLSPPHEAHFISVPVDEMASRGPLAGICPSHTSWGAYDTTSSGGGRQEFLGGHAAGCPGGGRREATVEVGCCDARAMPAGATPDAEGRWFMLDAMPGNCDLHFWGCKSCAPLATPAPPTRTPPTVIPQTHIPTTPIPPTHIPTTPIPPTHIPTTPIPPTHIPTTPIPPTVIPPTHIPTTGAPTTGRPSTGVPNTALPSTGVPTTGRPTTGTPNTAQPSTGVRRVAVAQEAAEPLRPAKLTLRQHGGRAVEAVRGTVENGWEGAPGEVPLGPDREAAVVYVDSSAGCEHAWAMPLREQGDVFMNVLYSVGCLLAAAVMTFLALHADVGMVEVVGARAIELCVRVSMLLFGVAMMVFVAVPLHAAIQEQTAAWDLHDARPRDNCTVLVGPAHAFECSYLDVSSSGCGVVRLAICREGVHPSPGARVPCYVSEDCRRADTVRYVKIYRPNSATWLGLLCIAVVYLFFFDVNYLFCVWTYSGGTRGAGAPDGGCEAEAEVALLGEGPWKPSAADGGGVAAAALLDAVETRRWRVRAVARVTSWAWEVGHLALVAVPGSAAVCAAAIDSCSGAVDGCAAENVLSASERGHWAARPDAEGALWMVLKVPADAAPVALRLWQPASNYATTVTVEREGPCGTWDEVASMCVGPGLQDVSLVTPMGAGGPAHLPHRPAGSVHAVDPAGGRGGYRHPQPGQPPACDKGNPLVRYSF